MQHYLDLDGPSLIIVVNAVFKLILEYLLWASDLSLPSELSQSDILQDFGELLCISRFTMLYCALLNKFTCCNYLNSNQFIECPKCYLKVTIKIKTNYSIDFRPSKLNLAAEWKGQYENDNKCDHKTACTYIKLVWLGVF